MKNILSYQNAVFSGKEILDWANYQIDNHTSHYGQGLRILNYFSKIKPDEDYIIQTSYETFSVNEIRKQIRILRKK